MLTKFTEVDDRHHSYLNGSGLILIERPIMRLTALLTILFLFFGLQLNAQSDTTKTQEIYKVTKHDGIEYVGEILSDDGREILILTKELGKIYIPKSEIKSIKLMEEEVVLSGNFREVGPFTTRYYFTNNALPVKKGEDYAMFHLYGPEAHFAVKDNWSVGVMASWIASPIGVAAKYAIPSKSDKVHFSLGTIMFSSGYLFKARGWGGLHWANMTIGKPGKNFTISGGFAYVDMGIGDRYDYETGTDRLIKAPSMSIAGIAPVGKKASFFFDSMFFLSEHRNYERTYGLLPDGTTDYNNPVTLYNSGTKFTAVIMPGMRFQKTDRSAFQFALSGVIEWSQLGFQYPSTGSEVRSFPAPMCSWFLKF